MYVYTKPELVKRKNYFRDLAAKHEKRVKELEAENSELRDKQKKAFWWSAEFTHTLHEGKIQKAWEDFNSIFKK